MELNSFADLTKEEMIEHQHIQNWEKYKAWCEALKKEPDTSRFKQFCINLKHCEEINQKLHDWVDHSQEEWAIKTSTGKNTVLHYLEDSHLICVLLLTPRASC